jgi:hypothetical protein
VPTAYLLFAVRRESQDTVVLARSTKAFLDRSLKPL